MIGLLEEVRKESELILEDLEWTAAIKVFVPDFSEKIEKEVAILSLNFATLRCGILTVTLRARFRCLSRSKEAPVEVPSSQGCPIRQNGTFSATEQNQA